MTETKVKVETKGWNGEDLELEVKEDGSMSHDNILIRSKGEVVYALHLGKGDLSIHSWTEKYPKYVCIAFGKSVVIDRKRIEVK